MPIPDTRLNRTLIPQVLPPETTLAELLAWFAAHPQPERCFAVLCAAADAYAVLARRDLRAHLYDLARELRMIPGLLVFEPPVYQVQIGEAQADRELARRATGRLVVLDAAGDVAGLLVATPLSATPGLESLPPMPALPPQLLARIPGHTPPRALRVGQTVSLEVLIGTPGADALGATPFSFPFANATDPVRFVVHVDGDPACWTIVPHATDLVVVPPGVTQTPSRWQITPLVAGRAPLHISLARDGVTLQHLWLTLHAADDPARMRLPAAASTQARTVLPLASSDLERPEVELDLHVRGEQTLLAVRAHLLSGVLRQTFRLPLSQQTLHQQARRLRDELLAVVYAPHGRGSRGPFPFADLDHLTVDPDLAQQACVTLADAGQMVWMGLFKHDPELRRLAAELRTLPHGSRIQITLNDPPCILPWALLYDAPDSVDAQTLRWDGFWGYRFVIDVLPLGRYPPTRIAAPAEVLLLLHDGADLRRFTDEQAQVAQGLFERGTAPLPAPVEGDPPAPIPGAQCAIARGHEQVRAALQAGSAAALVYSYGHGEHASSASAARRGMTPIAGDSALLFSDQQPVRIHDLRVWPAAPLPQRPLVFLNACEGATQEPFEYDGFVPLLIGELGARGVIGAEVEAPQLLAHDLALRFFRHFAAGEPVGRILWQLRRFYLEQHHTILAFNYSLYGLAETRLHTI